MFISEPQHSGILRHNMSISELQHSSFLRNNMFISEPPLAQLRLGSCNTFSSERPFAVLKLGMHHSHNLFTHEPARTPITSTWSTQGNGPLEAQYQCLATCIETLSQHRRPSVIVRSTRQGHMSIQSRDSGYELYLQTAESPQVTQDCEGPLAAKRALEIQSPQPAPTPTEPFVRAEGDCISRRTLGWRYTVSAAHRPFPLLMYH